MPAAHDRPPRAQAPARRWPRVRAWWLVPAAFAAGLLLFLAVWMGKRDEFAFYRSEGATRTAESQAFEPLPVPLPAGEVPASGMDDREPPPAGSARIDRQAAPPVGPTPSPQPTAPAAGTASTVPRLVHAPPPEYPRDALRSRASGDVVIRIDVGADGTPTALELVRSSRHRSLDRAALQAVRRWRFEPALRDGMPVAASVQQTVSFAAPN
jgi:periplasmic protein TonB